MRTVVMTLGCLLGALIGFGGTNAKYMTDCEKNWNLDPEEWKACDARCYNPSQGETCDPVNGVCAAPEEKCAPHEYYYDCYNRETQSCHKGIVCNIGEESCGIYCYNPGEKTCFHGMVCDVGLERCGGSCYDPKTSTKECKHDMALCEPEEEACGYNKCFNPTKGQSCHGMGIICESGEEYCGQCYNPAESAKKCLKGVKLCEEGEQLCQGRIYGWNWCYNPSKGQKCTENGVE